jgi:hypothetical protein
VVFLLRLISQNEFITNSLPLLVSTQITQCHLYNINRNKVLEPYTRRKKTKNRKKKHHRQGCKINIHENSMNLMVQVRHLLQIEAMSEHQTAWNPKYGNGTDIRRMQIEMWSKNARKI